MTRRLHINQGSIMEAVDMTTKADANKANCFVCVGLSLNTNEFMSLENHLIAFN